MKRISTAFSLLMLSLFATSIAHGQVPAPTYVNATVTGAGLVELNWTQVAPPATGYNIYRNGVLVESIAGAANTTFVDNNPIAGLINKYCVATVEGGTESPFKNCIIDSTFYQGTLIGSDYQSDAWIDVSWSLSGSCLLTPMNNDLYLEIRDMTNNKDIHTEVLKYEDLDSFTHSTSLKLNNQNYLLLDSNYSGVATTIPFNQLGQSIDIYQDYAVIGAPGADNDTGAAFVYKKTPGGWVQEAKLRPISPIVTDTFGYAVAIHGNRIIVGAPGGTGTAYIFEKSGGVWSQTSILTGTPAQVGDGFGHSVTIDSFTALVGAPFKYTGQGAMFYYHKYLGTWYRLARLVSPTPNAGQNFAISLQQHDNFLVVGGPGYNGNRGRAYVYEHIGFTWYYRSSINAPGTTPGDRFGTSVALYTNRAVVGSPGYNGARGRVSVFDRQGAVTNWPHDISFGPAGVQPGDGFGSGVAVYGDWLASASPNTSPANGTVYMFQRQGFGWTQTQAISRPSGLATDFFGAAFAMDDDDLMVGAPYENTNQGKVYIYERNGNTWDPNGILGQLEGKSLTVEFWVNRLDPQGISGPLMADDNVSLHITSVGNNRLNYRAGGGPPVYFNYRMPEGRWTHIAWVVDSASNSTKLYVNGELADEKGMFAPLGAERFGLTTIGGVTHYLNALVRDIRYWGVARDANQISNSYNTQLTGSESGLLGYWKLDEGSGNNMVDASGNYTPARFKPAPPVTWVVDSAPVGTVGLVRHYVGADKNVLYRMKAYAIGFGNSVCGTFLDTGRTLQYQYPTIVADTSRPDSVNFSWTNLSEAISYYRVFRDGKLIGLLDSTKESYADVFAYGDPNSLVNGEQYRYCFVPFSTRFLTNGNATVYDSVCVEGATYALDFTATDNTFPNKIRLNWRDISTYSDHLEITRDGVFFAQLDSNINTYTDNNPIPGKKHKYELRVMNDGKLVVAVIDTGSVDNIGVIAGRVVTQIRHYALDDLQVTATAIVQGDTLIYTQQTGLTGDFHFDVYFAEAATYSVSVASPAGFNIVTPAQNVPLSLADPVRDNLVFYGDKIITPTGTQPLSLTGLTATDQPGQDMIQLTWNYSSPDTTWFKIYRDNQLISILCDTNTAVVNSYNDLTGIPGTSYQYKVIAYVYDADTIVTESTGQSMATLSPLAPVSVLNATVNALAGTISLDWAHTSDNIDGFLLYRSGVLIADVHKDSTYFFEDFEGIPGTSYTYSIKVYAERTDSTHLSASTNATPSPIVYPGLNAPINFVANAIGADETVELTWRYGVNWNTNFFGFLLSRQGGGTTDTLAVYHRKFYESIGGAHYNYKYIDRSGKPGENYTYTLIAFKNEPAFTSTPVTDSEPFPVIQAVPVFAASDNAFHSWINLTWTDDCDNHDGYLIQRNGSDLVFLPKQARSYSDGLASKAPGHSFTYTIYPYRMINGVMYVGTLGNSDNGSTISTPVSTSPLVIIPQDVDASDNYSGHIQLSWSYPVYALSEFFIYRDGVLMDSAETTVRYWYDTSAVEGVTYIYSVRAQYLGVWSGYASDPGTLRPKMQVEGVAQGVDGFGIPDVLIQVEIGGDVLYNTYTDATGFYRIAGMTKVLNDTAFVTASGPNAKFIKSTKWVVMQDTSDRYEVNFIDTFYQNLIPSEPGVAQITSFMASIDPLTNKVNLTWNASSANFTGFKLYRELGEIADLDFSEPKFYLDLVAAPGFTYTYRIAAYWVLPEGTQTSEEALLSISVPKVAPVEALQAIPDYQEDLVRLYWSHPTDNHTYYEIKRNGVVVASINTGDRLLYVDTTGLPNHNYNYTVTCYELGPAGSFASDPRMVQSQFPDVAPVQLLSLIADPTDNRVDASWQHTSIYYDYALVYRNGEVIDTVFKDEPLKLSKDYWGVPNDTNAYSVSVVVEKEGQFYESDTVTRKILYPTVYPPSNIAATPGTDMMTITGDYIPLDGYTGFQFFRDGTMLEQKSGITPNYSFQDSDANPDSSYTYKVRAFKELNLPYYSTFDSITVTFPSLSPPFALVASDDEFFNHVEITWQYGSNANTGFIIYRDGVVLDTIGSTSIGNPSKVGAGVRRYLDVINDPEGLPSSFTYEVRAFKVREGNVYYSALSNSDQGSALVQSFSTVTSNTGGASNEHLGMSVALAQEFALAGTDGGTNLARTYVLDNTNTFVSQTTLTPDASSGTTPGFGWDVAVLDNQVAVSAPWAWDASSASPYYRSGEIYLYNLNNNTTTLDTILRNHNFQEERKSIDLRYNSTTGNTIVESNEWCSISGFNYFNPTSLGASDTSIGAIIAETDYSDGLAFNANVDFYLESVLVYPGEQGTIQVRVSNGGVLFNKSFNVNPTSPFDSVRLMINERIPAGTGYTIDANGTTLCPCAPACFFCGGEDGMLANSGGASYPFTTGNGTATITGRTGGGPADRYNFFYDWVVRELDTLGTRCHQDTTIYTRSVSLGTFSGSLSENRIGSGASTSDDLYLDSIYLKMNKWGGQDVWLENVTLVHASGAEMTLFSTNSDPSTCSQDSIDVMFDRNGGPLLASSGNCGPNVTGNYSPVGSWSTFDGDDPNGPWHLEYTVKLIDPDTAAINTLWDSVFVNSISLNFHTLPGGIHTAAITSGAQMGRSIAINGSVVAGGAPTYDGGVGSVTTFRKAGGAWGYQDTLDAPLNATGACTYVVHVFGPWWGDEVEWRLYDGGGTIISGGPYGFIFNQTAQGTSDQDVSFEINTQGFFLDNIAHYIVSSGGTVLISGVIGPGQYRNHGPVSGNCGVAQMGSALAMDDSKLLVGLPTSSDPSDGLGSKGEVLYYGLGSGNHWQQEQSIINSNPAGGDLFGTSLALSDNTLAVGAPGDQPDGGGAIAGAGSVVLYEYNAGNTEFDFSRKITNPDGAASGENFGFDVAMNGNLMAIGAPNADSSGGITDAGAVYLYEKNEDEVWVFKRRYYAPDGEQNAHFGSSVALGGNTLMVGAPDHGTNDEGKVYFFYIRDQIDSVIASDGTEGIKTRVSWVYEGVRNNLLGFNVYRDGSLIASADPNKNFVFDYDGVPGQKYIYQVRPVSLDEVEGVPKGDIGWSAPNGILDGQVITYVGNAGVKDVNIQAFSWVKGEFYVYDVKTDGNGDYKIKNMYYGDSTLYYVRAFLEGHEFKEDTLTMEFNLQQNERALDAFIDLTAYVVKGVAKYAGTDCPIDSIQVTQHTVKTDSTVVSEQATTDENGNYSFNIMPYDPEVDRYEYTIDSLRVIVGNNGSDTTYFSFGSGPSALTQLDTLGRNTTLEPFEDTTTYPVQIFVQTVCGPIDEPNPHQWQVQIKSKDGCYERNVLTDNNGRILLDMPPLDYSFRVVSVTNPNTTTLVAIDYLKVRPRRLDLLTFHKDLKGEKSDTIVPLDFVFHVSPNITLPDLTGFLCADPNLPVVIQQNNFYTINVDVNEKFGPDNCQVNEGFLMIRNDAARTSPTRIDYDPKKGGFPAYTFQAGEPNPVSPHVKFMFVEYHTESDGFLGEQIVAFIIEGIAQVPGNDVIVNPNSNSDGDLLLPLFVLRDPPGDGSSSKIDSGSTFETKVTVSENHKFTGGLNLELQFYVFSVGLKLGIEQSNGGGWENETELTVTTETTKSFSTSSDSEKDNATNSDWLTGNSADVLVGSGVALAYGIGREISVTDTCTVVSAKVITTGAEIKTTWIYTVDQIRNLIREYTDNIEAARNGLYKIVGKTQDETIDFLTVRKMNWEQMMVYHSVHTLPHYSFCDPQNFANIPEPWATAAANWRKSGFCEKIGSYSTENGQEVFIMKPDTTWTWDTDLLNRYNAVKQEVRDIENYLDYTGALTYSETRLNQVTIDQAYHAAFGPDAKNITFSGGTSYEESRSISKSKGTSYKQFWNNDTKVSLGQATDLEVTFYTGAWAGLGAGMVYEYKVEASKFEWALSGFFQYEFEYNETENTTQGSSQSVSYTLTDDDPGDQFSVTIVNGAIPTHTPFFALTGGRTSCPNEPGAIDRDVPRIDVLDPFGNPKNKVQFDQDPSKAVIFPMQFSNLNPFGEGRWYEVYVQENSNMNGATIKLGGVTLSSAGALGLSGVQTYFIPAEGSVYSYLSIEKGPYFYDYEDLNIAIRPTCDPYIVETVTLEVHFRHPCSQVSITRPGDGWVINSDTADIAVYLGDYDPFNPELKRIQLMYRRLGQLVTPSTWDTILSITADSLQNFYNINKPTYYHPTYPFSWEVPASLLDGEYELQALANCGTGGLIQSNTVRGTINRSKFTVFGTPQPSDGLLSLGEEVSVTFNKQIDCPKSMSVAEFEFRADSANGPLVSADMGCFGNKMVFVIDSLLKYEGRMIYASLDKVYDQNGNRQYEPTLWSFEVSNNPVYWYPRVLEVTVERGTEKEMTAKLLNTGAGTEAYTLSNNSAWLTPQVLAGVVPPAGEPIVMRFDARNLAVGTYNDVVTADIMGFTEETLPVIMHVIKPVPKWDVDPSAYEHNVSVIAIPEINGVESTDTNDIITAWIDGELRGKGKVQRVGSNYHAAYISVYGDAEDTTKLVDFRVWDANVGAEFQGHPEANIYFTAANTVYGTTPNPVNVLVNTTADSLRYIPLKKGWNWLSINTVLPSMSVSNVLKSLSLDHGDVIMTQTTSAEYIDTMGMTGWNTALGLTTIDNKKGYLLHLRHADTLRIAGTASPNSAITLFSGWNLIGYTPQHPWPIDTAFVVVVPAFDGGDVFKSQTQFSVYNADSTRWEGSLTTLKPYQAYKVKSGKTRNLNYRSNDPDDWEVEPAAFEHGMRIVATIKVSGFEFRDKVSKVAAFVDGECRGVGTLQYIEPLDRYRAQVFVYSNDPSEEVTFKFWDGLTDTVYDANQKLTYNPDAIVGRLVTPFVITPAGISSGTDHGQEQMQTSFAIWPNPFHTELMLTIDEHQPGDYIVTMYNSLGQLVLAQDVQTVPGPNRIYLNPGSGLSAGMYQVTIRRDNEIIESFKMLKQNE